LQFISQREDYRHYNILKNYLTYLEDRNIFNSIPAIIQNLKPKNSKAIPLSKLENVISTIHSNVAAHLNSVPCHNDLHPSNLIFLGDAFKAVDYERASLSDPYFDIAMAVVFYCENKTYENILFSTYLERQPTDIELAKLYLFKQIAWMHCALCFLTMLPDLLHTYETMQVPLYDEFMKEMSEGKINLENPEHRLKFAKVLINHIIRNFELQESRNAIELLGNKP
jgi:thiamine kinase-like enzyme